jgi:hypothetical protein
MTSTIRLLLLGTALLGIGCSSEDTSTSGTQLPGADAQAPNGATYSSVRTVASDKLDLLLAIDNSASMGDKQDFLGDALPELLDRLLSPNCVDEGGRVLAPSTAGTCAKGKPEFPPLVDMHIGVISSSLGSRGSDICTGAKDDDQGHLLNRTLAGAAVPDAAPAGFLAWLPPVEKNAGKPNPGVPALADPAKLYADFRDLVVGVGDKGCGFEAQLESVYRFLVQPDPYLKVTRTGEVTTLEGVDETILQQRHDFLRPDSLVAIVMLTDENESTVDPLAFGGRSVRYISQAHVKGGTAACATAPTSPACLSCYQSDAQGDPACSGGTVLSDADDALNVRFFHMKQRFGVDPRFPLDRYVRGFTQPRVPDRNGEHPVGEQGPSFDYVGQPNCQNPLFAANLPTKGDAQALCNTSAGPRQASGVFFTLIGGVPWQLLTEQPNDFSNGNKAPFKASLAPDDWQRLLGRNPLAYDFAGVDSHMLESLTARPGLGADDAHTNEWDTRRQQPEYACTFTLPKPKDCSLPQFQGTCDCEPTSGTPLAPVCDPANPKMQVKAKAYPTVNELVLAQALGAQATVASICPRNVTDKANADYGYRPAMRGLSAKIKTALSESCLAKSQAVAADGKVACTLLQVRRKAAAGAATCDAARGLKDPDPRIRQGLLDGEKATIGAETDAICEINQLASSDWVSGSCEDSTAAGWCYLESAKGARTQCLQTLKFSRAASPPPDSRLFLYCGP